MPHLKTLTVTPVRVTGAIAATLPSLSRQLRSRWPAQAQDGAKMVSGPHGTKLLKPPATAEEVDFVVRAGRAATSRWRRA